MSTEIKLTKDDEADSVDSSKYRGIGVETIVYADSDHTGNYVDHKSTSGVCTFMGCCLTSWFAKKQTALAIFTTEAEYTSTGKACQQALWMKQALIDYDIRLDDVLIMCDNKVPIRGEHGPRTRPDQPRPDRTKDRVGPKCQTEDRTEMVRSGPGRSSVRSGPIRHNHLIFGRTELDRTETETESNKNPRPRTGPKYVRSGPVGPVQSGPEQKKFSLKNSSHPFKLGRISSMWSLLGEFLKLSLSGPSNGDVISDEVMLRAKEIGMIIKRV
nr:retrotransposon protein [Tanacetum cinerariifolium]